jgi:hypothetical protein
MKLFANHVHPRVNLATTLMPRFGDLGLDLTGITRLSHLRDCRLCRVSNQLIVLLDSGERALSTPSAV